MSIFVAERPTQRARYRQLILTGIIDVDVEDVTKKTATNRPETRFRHFSGKEFDETNIKLPSTLDGSGFSWFGLSDTLPQNKPTCNYT